MVKDKVSKGRRFELVEEDPGAGTLIRDYLVAAIIQQMQIRSDCREISKMASILHS